MHLGKNSNMTNAPWSLIGTSASIEQDGAAHGVATQCLAKKTY